MRFRLGAESLVKPCDFATLERLLRELAEGPFRIE